MAAAKSRDTADAWETGALGREDAFVGVAPETAEEALDEALELQSISIRLPKQLIAQYKMIAAYHGVGYQPLMRDVMSRFVPNALKEILEIERDKATKVADTPPLVPSMKRAA